MNLFLIFPHQLFPDLALLKSFDSILLIEEPLLFGDSERVSNFNKLKLIMHRASMKLYEKLLKSKKLPVSYIPFNQDYSELLKSAKSITTFDVVDHLLRKRLDSFKVKYLDTPNFINTMKDLHNYDKFASSKKKKYFADTFYKYMRHHFKILLDSKGNPIGKYSYDSENRKPLKKDTSIPKIKTFQNKTEQKFIQEAQKYIEKHFPDNYGNPKNTHHLLISHSSAQAALEDFCQTRLIHFGDYQDAMLQGQPFLFHSVLSQAINVGLLNPLEVIHYVAEYGKKHDIPINNIEGFVRQILGWREYTRYLYEFAYDKIKNSNFFQSKNHLNEKWYTAKTGLLPVDDCIRQAFDYGYLHHIQRLMIMGNIMCLCKIHPDDVYRWFMEFSIDSYDWVMISNVYSMIIFADGGLTTTKPYISADGYVKRMSNYKPDGKWDMVWKVLFYNFIGTAEITKFGKKINYFSSNPRTVMMFYNWKRLENKEEIIKNGQKIIDELTTK